jgi:hypothetical protein
MRDSGEDGLPANHWVELSSLGLLCEIPSELLKQWDTRSASAQLQHQSLRTFVLAPLAVNGKKKPDARTAM